MSKLLSCFWQSKNKRDFSPQDTVKRRRRRRHSKENNELVYIDTGAHTEKQAENQHRFNGNVSSVYRTETNSQNSQHEKLSKPYSNRQSTSYPVSPERRSLCEDHSFEQRPSFEMQILAENRKYSTERKDLLAYAANVVCAVKTSVDSLPYGTPAENVPRRSTLSHDYEKEILIAKGSTRCIAERPAEEFYEPETSKDKPDFPSFGTDNDKNIQESEKQNTLRMSKINNENFSPRSSDIGNQKVIYLASGSIATEPESQTIGRAGPQSSKNFALGNSVKPMIYLAEDVEHSPMSARRYVHQMPVRANKQPPLLTTADGRILRPLTSENIKRLSTSSSKGNQPMTLSVVPPLETDEGFPLAQGGRVTVAAPMIGGARGGRRGGRGRSYYDDGPDMYPSASYYYDGGYGYYGEDMVGYGRAPTCGGCSKRKRSVRQIYATQIPDVTLPATTFGQGKNTLLLNTSEPSNTPETPIKNQHCDLKEENLGNTMKQLSKGSNVKFISSAQQTDPEKELDFICFSPEKFFTTTEGPHDPNTKLRWRIVIKRGDEE